MHTGRLSVVMVALPFPNIGYNNENKNDQYLSKRPFVLYGNFNFYFVC